MKKIRKSAASVLSLPSIKLEGALFLPGLLEDAALGNADYQKEADYHTPKGLRLKDDYSRSFQIACAQWKHFSSVMDRADIDAFAITRSFISELLQDVLGYSLNITSSILAADRSYPVAWVAGSVPIVVAPFNLGLDDADPQFAPVNIQHAGGSRKKSPFQLVQELLNASDDHLWGIVTNGKQLRLLRDSASLTRPSFLEVDLQDLLEGQRFSEFSNVWRLLHASRSGPNCHPEQCIWELWREAGKEAGFQVRAGLRNGVEEALKILGEGFIHHTANSKLLEQLNSGELTKEEYFQELLRLVYRLIFLFTVEERGLLHPRDEEKVAQEARQAYVQGYALSRLRSLSLKRRARNRFDDQWQTIRIVFRGLAEGEPRLALPALGGLFAYNQCPHLDSASISNEHLLLAIKHLRWANYEGNLAPVDYRNMGPEELGSVYESLLELDPRPDAIQLTFELVNTAGNDRKTSGSYYTPDSLVQELIKSALEPVIEQRLAENQHNPTDAILNIRVIDPACGSGHFLLAAARRLAETLAQLRATDGAVKPADYRHALREVISHCVFGVDRNPMALELARTALWLEGFEEGRPLSFIDHHLQCGDALLGVLDLKSLEFGIPKAAFKPLSGDDKEICKVINKKNTAELKDLEKKRQANQARQIDEFVSQDNSLEMLNRIEAMSGDTPEQEAAKEKAYHDFLATAVESPIRHAADMLVGAFLLAKTTETEHEIPTSANVYLELLGESGNAQQIKRLSTQKACNRARVFHWPLAFPQVFARGGFDCVLGNPPWERIKLQEEEFFASRHPDIVSAKNKAERNKRLQWLSEGKLGINLFPNLTHTERECDAERQLFNVFEAAKREAEAASIFFHIDGDEGGRYPLTGIGDVNTYALFAETIRKITLESGRAGFIVPTGIATDDSTKAFFGDITQKRELISLYDIENRDAIFPSVHRSYKFCLITLGSSEQADFVCFATRVSQLTDGRRHFTLSPEDFRLINPNSLNCPVFRSSRDAELTKKLYHAAPVLINENLENGNPWDIYFMAMMHMSGDSHHFHDSCDENLAPLYEAKMIHQFDHRWATYQSGKSRDVMNEEKANPNYSIEPRYWVSIDEINNKLNAKGWDRGWLMGWRDICRATDERTVIASIIPRVSAGDTLLLMFPNPIHKERNACLLADQCSLVHDFVARQKVGGTHLKYHMKKQITVLPPTAYSDEDIAFIVPRVLELTYTSYELKSWAEDLSYKGEPFIFDPERRAILRAELDAYYAKLYGLSIDDLRYILDPSDVMGDDYPSETFRVMKNKEVREYGYYRTRKLVLDAWERLEQPPSSTVDPYRIAANQQPAEQYIDLPDGLWARPNQDPGAETGIQLTAILQTMDSPLPESQVRLAATFALVPRLFVPFLKEQDAATWRRLIGSEADELPQGTASFAQRVNSSWGAAVRNLRTNGLLIEDFQSGTWSKGTGFDPEITKGWPEGRAKFVLDILQQQSFDALIGSLPDDIREWINVQAAA